ncbi:ECF subfamily RNA polymerase sigma-24 subunit [Anopheles sinensis]|uniref:ECF subfamily RNA polymerase sigma-24 subunit n=1 Tax=Anopheles sinensis TaxID=74873 RepID=A0A084W8R7_ANOSI|nr:ECF subfamily RNA polymerase sigma-24 subunit [Anopheles sinensis]
MICNASPSLLVYVDRIGPWELSAFLSQLTSVMKHVSSIPCYGSIHSCDLRQISNQPSVQLRSMRSVTAPDINHNAIELLGEWPRGENHLGYINPFAAAWTDGGGEGERKPQGSQCECNEGLLEKNEMEHDS